VKVFNGSFEEYKEMLRREFEGGSLLTNKKKAERRAKEEKEAKRSPPDAAAPRKPSQVRSIHWSPYDRVGVVNADP
jgi:ATP-binding cassette subfamily F protein 2